MKHAIASPPELGDAISLYQDFWSKLKLNETTFSKNQILFDGSPKDLDALFYCVYEVGFPEEDYFGASLIWAQVMVNNTEARWLESIRNNIVIGGPDDDYPRLIFFPHARLVEIAKGSQTQFDVFAILTDQFLFQGVLSGYSPVDLTKLRDLTFSQAYANYSDETQSHFDLLSISSRLLKKQRLHRIKSAPTSRA
ncbi:MAG: hypothetical protein ABIS50_25350 [Luteolibacter sp.]|uniref:hypothetical protein n=1 Tax=Luteolibacter sp. TaxID=1962973 RepID=UPI003264E8E7